MTIYHGSLDIVAHPEIRTPNRTLDYGSGFYTTTSFEQAAMWVKRKMQAYKTGKGYVNCYELNLSDNSTLSILRFDSPTEEWLDFVMQNRTDKTFRHAFDIVYGSVANDRVYTAFALYEGGLLNKQNLIAELKTYTLVDQYLFHTPQSLDCLSFIEAKEIML